MQDSQAQKRPEGSQGARGVQGFQNVRDASVLNEGFREVPDAFSPGIVAGERGPATNGESRALQL